VRVQTLNITARRGWFQIGLVIAAIAFLFWVKYRGPISIRDITSYLLFACALILTTYYCFRAVIARYQHGVSEGECVVLARAKSPAWFYAGSVGVGLAFILNAIVLLNLIADPAQLGNRLNSALNGGSDLHLFLGLSMCSFALGLLFAWMGAYQVQITSALFENWSLFGGYQSIHLAEIRLARIRNGWYRNRPPFRLEVVSSQSGGNDNPITVNLKVFCPADRDRIYHWLGTKLERHR
jgi:hypothetical protein